MTITAGFPDNSKAISTWTPYWEETIWIGTHSALTLPFFDQSMKRVFFGDDSCLYGNVGYGELTVNAQRKLRKFVSLMNSFLLMPVHRSYQMHQPTLRRQSVPKPLGYQKLWPSCCDRKSRFVGSRTQQKGHIYHGLSQVTAAGG